jgi:hypothetical protein
MNLAISTLALVGLVETGVLWFVARGLRRLEQVESRLGHLTDALTLLAETAEAGFHANAMEIGRMVERASTTSVLESGLITRISRSRLPPGG